MNRAEFVKYANEVLSGESLEPLFETIAQHNSEVDAFGDSWPGALIGINESIRKVNSIERQLARLEGREVRNFHLVARFPR